MVLFFAAEVAEFKLVGRAFPLPGTGTRLEATGVFPRQPDLVHESYKRTCVP